MIQPERVRELNRGGEAAGQYILYWMQQSQRSLYNHALEFAILQANERQLPLVVVFGLTDNYPEANLRHYHFMLHGLRDVEAGLRRRAIKFVLRHEEPWRAALALSSDAAMVVCDRGYLRIQRTWREKLAAEAQCPVVQVEADVVVPVDTASDKEEYAARTIRPKISRLLDKFLLPLSETKPRHSSLAMKFDGLDATDPDGILKNLKIDRSVGPCPDYPGGQSAAQQFLSEFVQSRLEGYAEGRNEPAANRVSHLSPYLHFGQVSPVQVALAVRDARQGADTDAFIEEMVVRRELSMNFVEHNDQYDSYGCLPNWARATLAKHARDKRTHLYTPGEWEMAATHDPYWNAAQREMVISGKMHNYMRMYWGKKIIEWSATPEEAFATALSLNNKYQLDGRDANSFTGVAWCFGKHDRPWTERPVFGTVRYMNAAGLNRKFEMAAYLRRVAELG